MSNRISRSLLSDIEYVCEARGWTHSRFGRNVMGDPAFVTDLRQGRNPTAKTLNKLYKWLGANRDVTGGSIIDSLLQDIEDVCKARGWTHSRFGRNVMDDPAFVTDLIQGRNPTAKTLDKLYRWLEADKDVVVEEHGAASLICPSKSTECVMVQAAKVRAFDETGSNIGLSEADLGGVVPSVGDVILWGTDSVNRRCYVVQHCIIRPDPDCTMVTLRVASRDCTPQEFDLV